MSILMNQEMTGRQQHQQDHTQISCTLFQAGNHARTLSLNFFTGWMLLSMPNQQCQTTDNVDIIDICSGTLVNQSSFNWL